jgi:hypothetical protein
MVISPAADGSNLLPPARPHNHCPDAECAIITQPVAAFFVLWNVSQIFATQAAHLIHRVVWFASKPAPTRGTKKAAAPEEAAAL